MTSIKVSELSTATTPYDGSEYSLGIQDNRSVKLPVPNLASAAGASLVGVTPTGTISATTVAGALTELDTEKATTTSVSLKANSSDLSASTGATLVGTIQTGTGAVARTVDAKLKETVSVLDFGADPTGVVDSASAIANTQSKVNLHGSILIPAGDYLYSGTTYNVESDFICSNNGLSGINLLSQARNNNILYTSVTSSSTVLDGTLSKIPIAVTVVANGAQHADGIRTNLVNYSTDGQGNTGIYCSATSAGTTTNWSASTHAETKHGGGTTICFNSESCSYEVTGTLIGAVISNTTAAGTTHSITGLPAQDATNAYGIEIQGGNSVSPYTGKGGWSKGIYFTNFSMRSGSIGIQFTQLTASAALIQSNASTTSTIADIYLQGSSANGIILNGTYSSNAIRIADNQTIGWRTDGTIRSKYDTASTEWRLYAGSTTLRVGFNLGTTPTMGFNGTQVVGVRATGWGTPTATVDKTAFTNGGITTFTQVEQKLSAIINALITHGLIGA